MKIRLQIIFKYVKLIFIGISKFINLTRDFLKMNEIFFKIFSSIALIFIAYQSIKITNYQNEIQISNSLPKFSLINEGIPKFDGTDYYYDYDLKISHISGTYDNFICNSIVFLEFEFFKNNQNQKYRVGIKDYYYGQESQGQNTGVIKIFRSNNNFPWLKKIRKICDTLKIKNNIDYINSDIIIYTQTSYYDFLGKLQINYYDCSHIEGLLIQNEVGRKKFDEHEDLIRTGKYYTLQQIDLNFINDFLKNY
jgi:hypothetical protein